MNETISDTEKLRTRDSANRHREQYPGSSIAEVDPTARQRIKDGFKVRFAECVKRKGSVYALSRAARIPVQTLQRYQRGSEPSLTILVAIADAASVYVEWLATGRGPKKKISDALSDNLRDPKVQAAIDHLIETVSGTPDIQ